MLEKLALLKIALWSAPVLSSASLRRSSVTTSSAPPVSSRTTRSCFCVVFTLAPCPICIDVGLELVAKRSGGPNFRSFCRLRGLGPGLFQCHFHFRCYCRLACRFLFREWPPNLECFYPQSSFRRHIRYPDKPWRWSGQRLEWTRSVQPSCSAARGRRHSVLRSSMPSGPHNSVGRKHRCHL